MRKIGGKGSFNLANHCVQYDKYVIVSEREENCVKVLDREGSFFYTNLERRSLGQGGSMNLISFQLTRLDTSWFVINRITEFRCLN